jgi:hypothetical protein
MWLMLRSFESCRLLIMITHILIGSCAVVLILLTLMCIHCKHNHMISNLATTLMSACSGTEKGGVSTKLYACNPEVHFSQVIIGKFYNITTFYKAKFAHTFFKSLSTCLATNAIYWATYRVVKGIAYHKLLSNKLFYLYSVKN